MKDFNGDELKLHDSVFFAWGDPTKDKPGPECLYRGEVTDLLATSDLVEVTASESVGQYPPCERFLAHPWELQKI